MVSLVVSLVVPVVVSFLHFLMFSHGHCIRKKPGELHGSTARTTGWRYTGGGWWGGTRAWVRGAVVHRGMGPGCPFPHCVPTVALPVTTVALPVTTVASF